MTKSPTSGAVRRSDQALTGLAAYACSHAGLWVNQIPTFDPEKPLG